MNDLEKDELNKKITEVDYRVTENVEYLENRMKKTTDYTTLMLLIDGLILILFPELNRLGAVLLLFITAFVLFFTRFVE